MTLGQMNSKLIKAQEAETHLDRALLCRALLEDAVDFIYSKVGAKKLSKASLLELIDSPVVTGYINDADTVNALHYVRILGMNAKHGRSVRKKEAKLAYDNIAYLLGLIASKENGTDRTTASITCPTARVASCPRKKSIPPQAIPRKPL